MRVQPAWFESCVICRRLRVERHEELCLISWFNVQDALLRCKVCCICLPLHLPVVGANVLHLELTV